MSFPLFRRVYYYDCYFILLYKRSIVHDVKFKYVDMEIDMKNKALVKICLFFGRCGFNTAKCIKINLISITIRSKGELK
jgi:hypothetical protein